MVQVLSEGVSEIVLAQCPAVMENIRTEPMCDETLYHITRTKTQGNQLLIDPE